MLVRVVGAHRVLAPRKARVQATVPEPVRQALPPLHVILAEPVAGVARALRNHSGRGDVGCP